MRRRVEILEDMVRVLLESTQKQVNDEGYDAKDVLSDYMQRYQNLQRVDKGQRDLDERQNRFR